MGLAKCGFYEVRLLGNEQEGKMKKYVKILIISILAFIVFPNNIFAVTIKSSISSDSNTGILPAYQEMKSVSNQRNGIYVQWKKSENADSYNIYRKEGVTGKWKRIKTVSGRDNTKYLDKDVKNQNGKLYYYTVRGVIGKRLGKYNKTGKAIVRLRTSGLIVENGNTEGTVSLLWQRNGAATGYEIQYGTDKNFKTYKKVQIAGRLKKAIDMDGLTGGMTYYFCQRCYRVVDGKKYFSHWSTKKSVFIKNATNTVGNVDDIYESYYTIACQYLGRYRIKILLIDLDGDSIQELFLRAQEYKNPLAKELGYDGYTMINGKATYMGTAIWSLGFSYKDNTILCATGDGALARYTIVNKKLVDVYTPQFFGDREAYFDFIKNEKPMYKEPESSAEISSKTELRAFLRKYLK